MINRDCLGSTKKKLRYFVFIRATCGMEFDKREEKGTKNKQQRKEGFFHLPNYFYF